MQDENEVSVLGNVVIDKLPCELVVAGFFEEYSQYLALYKSTEQSPVSLLSLFFYFLSWLMIVVGGFTLFFGPETISYSSRTGPSFLQFIQIYPGPIVSVGFFLLAFGKYVDVDSSVALLAPERFLVAFYALHLPEGLENRGEISIEHVDGDLFRITCVSP
ncbi:hypothetical protein K5D43_17465 [Pseudomonas cichorii]|nr:hypothetical protein [Pseudomonas cichorii]MBX8556261.1 hypothetical protein [Pseudomonas cichorii]MBX8597753.1 hypothetical protein [Pseudomonas cichorii]MBX8617453.1 hypothetical protein [Pseudomonas cichorii]